MTTPETTQAIFIDGDQLTLAESRFLKRCKQFHEQNKDDTEDLRKKCKNKENPNVAHNWKNVLVDIDWLLGWVAAGYGWCATHFHKRHRNAQNAAGSNTVVIDFDGDCTLNYFWSTDTAKNCIATCPC